MSAKLDVPRGLVREMAAAGYTRADVAAECGVSVTTVKRRAKEYGARFRRGGRLAVPARVEVLNLVGAGCRNAGEVARRMGRVRSRALVARWLAEFERAGLVGRAGRGRNAKVWLTGWRPGEGGGRG